MDWLIWMGAAISLGGVAMLLWCIRLVAAIRRADLDADAQRARMQRAVALNVGALSVSGVGLMMVVVGIILG